MSGLSLLYTALTTMKAWLTLAYLFCCICLFGLSPHVIFSHFIFKCYFSFAFFWSRVNRRHYSLSQVANTCFYSPLAHPAIAWIFIQHYQLFFCPWFFQVHLSRIKRLFYLHVLSHVDKFLILLLVPSLHINSSFNKTKWEAQFVFLVFLRITIWWPWV